MFETYPDQSWTLKEWGEVAKTNVTKLHSTMETIFHKADIVSECPSRSTVSDWWNKQGIPTQKVAVAVMAALRELAKRNFVELFQGSNYIDHMRIFMSSKACKHHFGLSLDDVNFITQGISQDQGFTSLQPSLLSLVRPQPPKKLRGRDATLDSLMVALDENPIVVINSEPGNGKTSLAWFAARQGIGHNWFSAMDWTTDKRVFLSAEGQVNRLNDPPLNEEGILESMRLRFGWTDLLGDTGRYLERACHQKLQEGKYLLVVDNIETVPHAQQLVDWLTSLLMPRSFWTNKRARVHSRVLITSRKAITTDYCASIQIGGIDRSGWIDLVRDTERKFTRGSSLLSDYECIQLGETYLGNPLAMRIAITRLYTSGDAQLFKSLTDTSRATSLLREEFDILFGPLVEQLNAEERWLAGLIADENDQTFQDLNENWKINYSHLDNQIDPFDEGHLLRCIDRLLRWHIVDQTDSGTFVMHPLIRQYLISEFS